MEEIDIVITWVDGSDPIWLAEKVRYHPMYSVEIQNGDANSDCRYRSNQDLLRYWFRLIEKNAPWVRKIHFITCGQKPVWLKEDHPKISLVYHNDYLPKEYLPTFNSNVNELNLLPSTCPIMFYFFKKSRLSALLVSSGKQNGFNLFLFYEACQLFLKF